MDLLIEKSLGLLSLEPGSGLAQTILLTMIYLNTRFLKKAYVRLEENDDKHEKRIGVLETKSQSHEIRIIGLEAKK